MERDEVNEQDLFKDLLEDTDEDSEEEEKSEEEKKKEEEERQKNKNAEEARKRREAEAKAKSDADAKAKADADAAAKAKAETETNGTDEKAKKNEENRAKLGEQLIEFSKKYPDVKLTDLDKDKAFKQYIDEKLLGKKSFIQLYEEFVEVKKAISGNKDDKNEQDGGEDPRANASSGSSTGKGSGSGATDVYSEEEFDRLVSKIPFMSDNEFKKIEAKFNKSYSYYKKK
jgi:membrane protein involved in colicin uptake